MRYRYLFAGGGGLLLLVIAWRLSLTSAEETGAMAVDCNAVLPSVQSACAYASGAAFSAQVHVTAAPNEGYFSFQTKLAWDGAALDYQPAVDPQHEALWPHCTIPARADNRPDPSVLFACVPFPSLPVGDRTTGAVLQFQFVCGRDAASPLALLPLAGDPQAGTHFLGEQQRTVEPVLRDARVVCGTPPTPTPCPAEGCPAATATFGPGTPRPTRTPAPTATPEPLPDLRLAAGCSPDTVRPDEEALLTCAFSVTNADPSAVSGARLEFGFAEGLTPVWFHPFDLAIDGQPVDVARSQAAFPLPDLASGETSEVTGRFMVRAWREGDFGQDLRLVYAGRIVAASALRFAAAADAPYPPTRLAVSKALLNPPDFDAFAPSLPPPLETAEYEVRIINRSDTALSGVTVLDRYSLELRPVSAAPPPDAIDAARHMVRWEVGTLQPGEERQVRLSLASIDDCSPALNDAVVTAVSNEGGEAYAVTSSDFYAVGTNWDCVLLTDHTLAPAPTSTPTVTPTAEPDGGTGPGRGGGGAGAGTLDGDGAPGDDGGGPSAGVLSTTAGQTAGPTGLPSTGRGSGTHGASRAWAAALAASALAVVGLAALAYWRSSSSRWRP